MALTYNPKVGDVLECDFGDYRTPPLAPIYDGRLQPEMVKRRLVVVLNAKIHRACIVVPLSTTKDTAKLASGMHVELLESEIPDLAYFTKQLRWAKSDLVSQVSHERLFKLRAPTRGYTDHALSRERVADIQRAVVKSISASWLLAPAIDTVVSK